MCNDVLYMCFTQVWQGGYHIAHSCCDPTLQRMPRKIESIKNSSTKVLSQVHSVATHSINHVVIVVFLCNPNIVKVIVIDQIHQINFFLSIFLKCRHWILRKPMSVV